MYKVTNKMEDVRRFRDGNSGKDIHVGPGKSVLTTRPPQESDVWKVGPVKEKKEEKIIKKEKEEEIENDSSSS